MEGCLHPSEFLALIEEGCECRLDLRLNAMEGCLTEPEWAEEVFPDFLV